MDRHRQRQRCTRTSWATQGRTRSTSTSTIRWSTTTVPASFPTRSIPRSSSPTPTGRSANNDIFWNNFNYFLPKSPVKTVSGGLGMIGDRTVNYPTGVGVVLFGSDGWLVKNNNIFGNFMWGAAAVLGSVQRRGGQREQHLRRQQDGPNGTDTNRFDFFNDGSGKGNCFKGNSSSTFDISPTASHPQSFLYPSCPAPNSAGTGTNQGDGANDLKGQVGALADYVVLAIPPCSQEDLWLRHSHPDVQGAHADRHQELRQVHEAGPMRALTRIGILVALAALARRRPRRHRRREPARQGEPAGEGQGPRRLLQADQRQDQEEQEGQVEVGHRTSTPTT